MPTTTNAQRRSQVRLLIRDLDTVRPFWLDAEIDRFLGEQLADAHAWIPRKKETQSLAYLATERVQTATFTGEPSAVVRAYYGSATGRPLEEIRHSKVRWLQETEGRTGEATVFGVAQIAAQQHEVAVYPLSAQTIVIEERIFVAEEPTTGGADFYEDMGFYQQFNVVRRAAYRLAQIMGWSDSSLVGLGIVDSLFGEAELGLRRRWEGPEANGEDIRDVIVAGGR